MKNNDNRQANGLDRSSINALAVASQVGLGIVLPPVGGALIGWYLDSQVFHSSVPIATIIGLLLGLAAGIYGLFRLISLLS
jgi:F0F1-type ATP synthase assembly protein I